MSLTLKPLVTASLALLLAACGQAPEEAAPEAPAEEPPARKVSGGAG